GDVVVVDGHEFPITRRVEDGFTVIKAGGQRYRVEVADGASGGTIEAQVDHRPFTFQIEGNLGGGASTARAARPARGRSTASGQKGAIVAPMAGTVLKHVAAVGDAVEAGAV